MARKAPPSRQNSKATERAKQAPSRTSVSHDIDAKIERARRARDARRASERVPKELERPATKRQREELKAHGFRTTKRGVIVDGPRDKRREPIKGAKLQILKGGVIKTSVGQRRDFIYGFTKKEKREFAKDPAAFQKKKLAELRVMFPTLKRARKPQIRLQWGAYQATKDFAPSYFTAQYFAAVSPEEIRKAGKRNARPRADKLTGLHIVVHVAKEKGKRRAKGRKRK